MTDQPTGTRPEIDPTPWDYGSTPYDVLYKFLSCDGDFQEGDTTPDDCAHNAKAILSRFAAAGFAIVPLAALPSAPTGEDARPTRSQLYSLAADTRRDNDSSVDRYFAAGQRRLIDALIAAGYAREDDV